MKGRAGSLAPLLTCLALLCCPGEEQGRCFLVLQPVRGQGQLWAALSSLLSEVTGARDLNTYQGCGRTADPEMAPGSISDWVDTIMAWMSEQATQIRMVRRKLSPWTPTWP